MKPLNRKRKKINENRFKDLWDNTNCTNICIIGSPEEKWERKGQNVFEDIKPENFPNLGRETFQTGSAQRGQTKTHCNCCSVAKSRQILCDLLNCNMPGFLVLHCLRVSSNSCPLSQWCHPTISSSVALFFSCPQSFPGYFPVNWLFPTSGQRIGASASASVLPVDIQGWFPLGLTCLNSFQSKGLSRVFSGTLIQKHQFFGAQPSLWSNFYICTWLLEKP